MDKHIGQTIIHDNLRNWIDRLSWKFYYQFLSDGSLVASTNLLVNGTFSQSNTLVSQLLDWYENVALIFARKRNLIHPNQNRDLFSSAYGYLINSMLCWKSNFFRIDDEDTHYGPKPKGIQGSEFQDHLDVLSVMETVECLLRSERVTFRTEVHKSKLVSLAEDLISELPPSYSKYEDKSSLILITPKNFWDFFIYRHPSYTELPDDNPFSLVVTEAEKNGWEFESALSVLS